jgi:uncharacterized membrane protein YfcA
MHLDLLQYGLGVLCGTLVGLTLGLFGGGGSILALPLMVYVVGVSNPHFAIGTSALAVAVNAAANLVGHARCGRVNWPCAIIYSCCGVVGAFVGSTLGKLVDGQHLLILFALLMMIVGTKMFKARLAGGNPQAQCSRQNAPTVAAFGSLTGILSGFFGIGGGFLIVPGLIAATGMNILLAIGSSLVAVTAFGLTTAFNYALSGLVDWGLAGTFIGGGVIGGRLGGRLASRLSARKGMLNIQFAIFIYFVAGYVFIKGILAFNLPN